MTGLHWFRRCLVRGLIDNELRTIPKEAIVADFMDSSDKLPAMTEKKHGKFQAIPNYELYIVFSIEPTPPANYCLGID
jgi:hypothetical protein